MIKQISDNEIYLLIKYTKSILWTVAKRLSYKEDARCLKVNVQVEYNEINEKAMKTNTPFETSYLIQCFCQLLL